MTDPTPIVGPDDTDLNDLIEPEEATPFVAKKFQKKPVVIEAVQFTQETIGEVREFLKDVNVRWTFYHQANSDEVPVICGENDFPIEEIKASVEIDYVTVDCDENAWIIRGVGGEIYPCEDSLFQDCYEEVQE